MKNPWVIIGVITIVLFGGAILFSGMSSEQNNEGVEIIQHIKGNLDAKVSLVEFSDFQCPACSAFSPVMEEVMAEYGDSISFEYKHFPLSIHPHALPAAVAAEAAGQQGKFFEFHDLLFEKQQTWSNAASPNAFFIQYAEQLELDVPTFKRHMSSSLLRDKAKDEFSEGRALGVTGTPTVFLNGVKMQYESYQSFIEQIAFAIDPSAVASSTDSGATQSSSDSGVRFGI